MDFENLILTFANNLLPIMLISAGGFLMGRYLSVDARTVGRLAFYFFLPVLVFNLMTHSQLSAQEITGTMSAAALVMLSVGALAFLMARLLKLERQVTMAAIICVMFANAGNYGIPLVTFAFGKEAAAYAGIYFVASNLLFNTIGVLVASLGHMNIRQALLGLFKIPMVYGLALALLMNLTHTTMPVAVDRAVTQAANGAIPLMLILLGIELSRVQWSHNLKALSLTAGLRLLVGPLIGLLVASLFPLNPLARAAIIVGASMPSAVSNTVLASEYQLDSSFVTAVVFVGTLVSPLTLTPLLAFLGAHP